MYHYVRDYRSTRFPDIKGLDVEEFREQLRYIKKFYNVVSMQDVLAWLDGESIAPKPLLLTFDDAYLDHFDFVFPELRRLSMQGSFFVPVEAIKEKRILDVNKIHVLLAVSADKSALLKEMFRCIDRLRANDVAIPSQAECTELSKGRGNRYDSEDVCLFKKVLQRVLSRPIAQQVLDTLLESRGLGDLENLWSEIYMSENMIHELKREHMFIGAHGYRHVWLDSLAPVELKTELEQSVGFLADLEIPSDQWTLCYPYGGYNAEVLAEAARSGFRMALTTKVGVSDRSDRLQIPRLDTNDLPKLPGASPNAWYYEA